MPNCIELILTIYEFVLVAEQWMLILSKNGKILSKIHEIVSLGNISLNSSSDRFWNPLLQRNLSSSHYLCCFSGIFQSFSLQTSITASATNRITSLPSPKLVSKLSYSPWTALLNFLFLLNLSNICISGIAFMLNAEFFSYLTLNYCIWSLIS